MDYEFKSIEELYHRVRPALHAKEIEFHRLGYSLIKDIDIWNYLILQKWKNGRGLMLSDIVDDIMNLNCKEVYLYLSSNSDSKKKRSNDGLEIL